MNKGVDEKFIDSEIKKVNQPRYPSAVGKLAHGAVLMGRDDFASQFDMGVPLDHTTSDNSQVLMLYNRPGALPKNRTVAYAATKAGPVPVAASAKDATENCDFLNVILTDFKQDRAQCLAIMGQYEAFHIQKFMRLPAVGELNRKDPLTLVNRGAQKNGRKSTKPPLKSHTLQYWKTLAPYLENLPNVLEKLEPVARKVAGSSNTVVVMMCNFGQAELLFNFICHARSRNLDLSHILLFATDLETKALAENLGLTVWYDEKVRSRQDMPDKICQYSVVQHLQGRLGQTCLSVYNVNARDGKEHIANSQFLCRHLERCQRRPLDSTRIPSLRK